VTGFVSSQQGLFGVAATLRRTERKPGAPAYARLAEADASRLDHPAFHQAATRRAKQDNSEQHQPLAGKVSPETLLEASLISTTLLVVGDSPSIRLAATRAEWAPPVSSLSLRDRSV